MAAPELPEDEALDLSLIPDSRSRVNAIADESTSTLDHYSREFKIHCASVYLLKGTVKGTSDQLQIPHMTVVNWVASAWWKVAIEAARKQFSAEIIGGFSQIQQAATAGILDRISNGNSVLKDGELVRVPMNGKDLAVTLAIATDKRQIMTGGTVSKRYNNHKTAEQRGEELRQKARDRGGLKVVGGTEAE